MQLALQNLRNGALGKQQKLTANILQMSLKILITGACGFVGCSIIQSAKEAGLAWDIVGIDNLSRPGSEINRGLLRRLGVRLVHGDVRCASDIDGLPPVDWILDAAAKPSVLSGTDGETSSKQLIEHNLQGTLNLLEKCKNNRAGFILLSTSRVYSIVPLASLPLEVNQNAFHPAQGAELPHGISGEGISEDFSTTPPVSLYGASKLASEVLAQEYGSAFDFPVWINRCGVLAGAGQFGRPDQGIFTFWIHMHLAKRPLRYIGFGGHGYQVRDCLHPRDLLSLLERQINSTTRRSGRSVFNVSGGIDSAMSLRQLTEWCDARFGPCPVMSDPAPRSFDLPWVVLDSALAHAVWAWKPETAVTEILEEIACHATAHPEWLELSGVE